MWKFKNPFTDVGFKRIFGQGIVEYRQADAFSGRGCRNVEHRRRGAVGHVFDQPMISDTDYWDRFANSDYKPQSCQACDRVERCDCGCREVANILSGNPCNVDSSVFLPQ